MMNSSKSLENDCESKTGLNDSGDEFGPSWKYPALKSQSAPADVWCRRSETDDPSHKPGHFSDVPCGGSSSIAALLSDSTGRDHPKSQRKQSVSCPMQ